MRWRTYKEIQKNGQDVWIIRRWVNGKHERYPIKKYRAIRHDVDALEALVKRLNAPYDLRTKVEFKHAFINDELLGEYHTYLLNTIPSHEGAGTELSYLKRYFLNYFINELQLYRPEEWLREHETKWAAFLLSKKAPASAKTKRDIINAANRFIKWLHKKRPEEVPVMEFDPITKAKFRDIEARREMNGDMLERQILEEEHITDILKNLPSSIAPFIKLCIFYGLRRAECLGVKSGDVKKDYLSLERQQKKLNVFSPTKGRNKRKIPHWFCPASDAYAWVEEAQQLRMHPRTFSERWEELMVALGYTYLLHDLRHTYITKAIRKHAAREVQLAAGHKDLRITMQYLHDDRNLGDEEFVPEAG